MQTWNTTIAPGFARIVDGNLHRLSTVLPPFDGETVGLHGLPRAERTAAGWYEVASCPDPNTINTPDGIEPVRTIYDLGTVNTEAGTATLIKLS